MPLIPYHYQVRVRIIETSGHIEAVRVLCHLIFGRWAMYHVGVY
jgi:hypothetical protein